MQRLLFVCITFMSFFSVANASIYLPSQLDIKMEGNVLSGACLIEIYSGNRGSINLGSVYNDGSLGDIVPIKFRVSDCNETDKENVYLKLSKLNLVDPDGSSAQLRVVQSNKVWVNLWKDPEGRIPLNPKEDQISFKVAKPGQELLLGGVWAQLQSSANAPVTKVSTQGHFLIFYK